MKTDELRQRDLRKMATPSDPALDIPESIESAGGSNDRTSGMLTDGFAGEGAVSTGEVKVLAGSKRPISTLKSLPPINREGRNLTEKKLRRLEKNRLSARECRRKKREQARSLEREINCLEAENLRLRLQLQVCIFELHCFSPRPVSLSVYQTCARPL